MDILSELIEQIRKEEREKILSEIQLATNQSKEIPWKNVMGYIKSSMEHIGLTPACCHYQILNAFSVIIRHTLALDRMAQLNPEQEQIAKTLIDELIDLISVNRKEA